MATLTTGLRRLLLASLVVGLAGFGGCLATPDGSSRQWVSVGVMIVALTIALGSLVALPAARALQSGAGRSLPSLALAFTALGTLIAAGLEITHALNFSDRPLWERVARFVFPIAVAAVITSALSASSSVRIEPRFRWLQAVASAAGIALVALLFGMVAIDTGNRALFTVLGLLLATGVLSCAAIMVIARRGRRQSTAR